MFCRFVVVVVFVFGPETATVLCTVQHSTIKYSTVQYTPRTVVVPNYILCVCVCVVIPFILDVRFVDVPAGVTQDFSTFLLRCLP